MSPKKQVAGSDSLSQQYPTGWSMEMCYPSGVILGWRNSNSDDKAMTTTTTKGQLGVEPLVAVACTLFGGKVREIKVPGRIFQKLNIFACSIA